MMLSVCEVNYINMQDVIRDAKRNYETWVFSNENHVRSFVLLRRPNMILTHKKNGGVMVIIPWFDGHQERRV